jgi:hypothetical protein
MFSRYLVDYPSARAGWQQRDQRNAFSIIAPFLANAPAREQRYPPVFGGFSAFTMSSTRDPITWKEMANNRTADTAVL